MEEIFKGYRIIAQNHRSLYDSMIPVYDLSTHSVSFCHPGIQSHTPLTQHTQQWQRFLPHTSPQPIFFRLSCFSPCCRMLKIRRYYCARATRGSACKYCGFHTLTQKSLLFYLADQEKYRIPLLSGVLENILHLRGIKQVMKRTIHLWEGNFVSVHLVVPAGQTY